MQRKYLLRSLLTLLLIAGSYLVLRSTAAVNEASSTCSMEQRKECTKPSVNQGDMLWEAPARQFFSTILFSY